jgi:pimeloyl-ACP methyl ester carboxylesterase
LAIPRGTMGSTGRMGMETRLLRLPAGDGATLGILERRPHAAAADTRPLLLLHGATFGVAFLDLPRPGYSLMAALADTGRAVYSLDIRGYGSSHGFPAMERPPDQNPPFARIGEAVADIAAAVDFILNREGVDALDLLGLSWGSVAAARYAGEHPQKIGCLVLYAPLYGEENAAWLDRIADPQDRSRLNPKFGAYRLIALDDVVQRWNSDLPPGDPAQYRDDGLAEAVFQTLAALDPRSSALTPRAFRCPNGALADLVQVFSGKPLYDPAKLTMPVLLLRGADDTTSTESDSLQLLSRIGSRERDYRVIAPGSHFLCIEKNRSRLYEEINRFLERWSVAIGSGEKT